MPGRPLRASHPFPPVFVLCSATCRDSYGQPESIHAPKGEDTRALCTSEYSDISPLTGGNIAFSTLEGRPSAYFFDTSAELQASLGARCWWPTRPSGRRSRAVFPV